MKSHKRLLPPLRNKDIQLELFDYKGICSQFAATTHIGNYFEKLTAEILGARRFKCIAGMQCPDLLWTNNRILECKAMNSSSGRAVIDEGVAAAYKKLCDKTRNTLWYSIWIYYYNNISKCRTVAELTFCLDSCSKELFIMTQSFVDEIAVKGSSWRFKGEKWNARGKCRNGKLIFVIGAKLKKYYWSRTEHLQEKSISIYQRPGDSRPLILSNKEVKDDKR
ncbi:MAG: hypothetical protein FVQ84_08415 [Planctomycetes bacterium]|nr:hypothetical protein [Planctomycetota bacterium]